MQAWILSEWKIVALENYTDINKDLSNQIYDGIDYICDFDNCNSVKEMFPNIYKTLLEQEKVDFEKRQWNYSYSDDNAEFRDPTSWKIVSHVTNAIKVERTYSYGNSDSKIYRFYNSSNIYPLEVSWYDYVLDVNSYNTNDNEDYVKIDIKKSIMSISLWANVEELSTDEILNTLRKKHTQTNNNLSKEERSFEIQSDSYEWMFLLQSAAIPANADTNIEEIEWRLYLDGIIILKRK